VVVDDVEKVSVLNSHFSSVGEEGKSGNYDVDFKRDVHEFLTASAGLFESSSGSDFPENGLLSESEIAFALRWGRSARSCSRSRNLRRGGRRF
jgi:hypothetical protein